MAQIIKFPRRTKKEAYLLAFKALLTECPCVECQQYLKLLKNNPAEAEKFLTGRD